MRLFSNKASTAPATVDEFRKQGVDPHFLEDLQHATVPYRVREGASLECSAHKSGDRPEVNTTVLRRAINGISNRLLQTSFCLLNHIPLQAIFNPVTRGRRGGMRS